MAKEIWFTSDTHFGHTEVLDMNSRALNMGIKTVEEHDALIIDLTNKYIKKEDVLWHLGDYCWKNPGHYRNRINCREMHLCFGNHDKSNYGQQFSTAQNVKSLKITIPNSDLLTPDERIKIFLSHYPHAIWPSSHHGSMHLYGHCHRMREGTLNELWPERRSMDVGVDNIFALLGSYRPIHISEVFNLLSPRKGHDPVEWYAVNWGAIKR